MNRRYAWTFTCLLAVASCEGDDSQCGAACIGNVSLRLHKVQWDDGLHELIVRYPRYDGMHEVRCSFELPSTGTETRCEGDGEGNDPQWVHISVDATVNVHLGNIQRGDIEIEAVPPEGEAHAELVRPAYTEHEICGQVCVSASEIVDLDD